MHQLGTIRTSGESCVRPERLRALRPRVWRLPPLGMAPATSTSSAVTAVRGVLICRPGGPELATHVYELASVHRRI
jgi:hypothetical protein